MKNLIYFDGVLYCIIGLLTFLGAYFSTDEPAKYIAPTTLFWTRLVVGALSATFLALKMYRSGAYRDEREKREAQEKLANVTKVETVSTVETTQSSS